MTEGAGSAISPLAQLAALSRVMAIAEFEPDGTLIHANDNYLSLFGFTREEALGRHHSSFCLPAYASSDDYGDFWARLRGGEAHSGLAERMRSDGSSCWLEATYTPVLDGAGRVLQVLKIATDISERLLLERAQQEHLQRLSLVADASDTAVMISDGDLRIAYVNAGFSRMLGWSLEEIHGEQALALLAPQLPDAGIAEYDAALREGHSAEREEIVVGKDGQRYWAKIISNPIFDEAGRWSYTVTLLTDITRSKMHEALQHRALEAMAREQPLTEVLELICQEVERIAPEITASILEVDDQGRLRPLAAPSLPQDYCQQLDGVPIGPTVGSCGTAAWRNQTVRVDDIAHDPLWADYRQLVLPLGFIGCWSTPIRDSQGRVIGTFAFYFRKPRTEAALTFHQRLVDASAHLCTLALERERSRQRIRQLAFYDGLTGMPNRSLLQAKADQAIAAAARQEELVAVLFIDLDRFKQVNDSLGHPAGDELLRQAADRMQSQLRASDIAGRLSGDEFVAVLPQCDADGAADIVERLQTLLAQPMTIANTVLTVSASVGIAMFPSDGRDMETLLQRADMAMYQAKSSGRGCFSFFSSEMNRLAQERLVLENALREALRKGQLHLHYQPQVELASGRLYGVEALARWRHPELGEISPARFIPLAEECGLPAAGGVARQGAGGAGRRGEPVAHQLPQSRLAPDDRRHPAGQRADARGPDRGADRERPAGHQSQHHEDHRGSPCPGGAPVDGRLRHGLFQSQLSAPPAGLRAEVGSQLRRRPRPRRGRPRPEQRHPRHRQEPAPHRRRRGRGNRDPASDAARTGLPRGPGLPVLPSAGTAGFRALAGRSDGGGGAGGLTPLLGLRGFAAEGRFSGSVCASIFYGFFTPAPPGSR